MGAIVRPMELVLLLVLVSREGVLLSLVTVFPRTRRFDILSVSEPRSDDVPPRRTCKLDIIVVSEPRSSSGKARDVMWLRAERKTGDWMIVDSKRSWCPVSDPFPHVPLCMLLTGMYGLALNAEDDPIGFAVAAFALCFMAEVLVDSDDREANCKRLSSCSKQVCEQLGRSAKLAISKMLCRFQNALPAHELDMPSRKSR